MNMNNLSTQDSAAPISGQIAVQVYISDSLQIKAREGEEARETGSPHTIYHRIAIRSLKYQPIKTFIELIKLQ